MSEDDLGSEIPEFVKKYVPGITRGLSWAKYSQEKAKGTEMKVDAYNESKKKGYQKAIEVSSDDIEKVFEETKRNYGLRLKSLTTRQRDSFSSKQKIEEEETKFLLAKEAARNAGCRGNRSRMGKRLE